MLISVIIPSYKPQEYIWKCLDSLNEQTLSKSLFEIVVVLNGCHEPYFSYISDGIKKYTTLNIRFIHTDERGVSNARNIGLSSTNSDYICFLDDDDWVSASYLECLMAKAGKDTIVASNVLAFNEDTQTYSEDYITKAFARFVPESHISLFRGRKFMSSSCCKLIPRSVIGNKRFDNRFAIGEDALFMASVSSSVSYITLADKNAVYYRRLRAYSASRSKTPVKQKLTNSFKLCLAYSVLYMKDIRHNDFLFYLSRIVATILRIVK